MYYNQYTIRRKLFKTILLFSVLFSFCLLHGQSNEGISVKPLKATYEWNERVIIEYAGLPIRDAYSGRYDDIIVVPAGTPDNKYTEAQRVYASKPSGQAEFVLTKGGQYEVRVYLYEKPGIVAARSAPFQVLSVEEGALSSKTEEALVQIATRNKNRDKVLMCNAVNEYLNRPSITNHPSYTGMKALHSLCPKPIGKTISNTTTVAYPIIARYQCYRLMSTGNEIAEDIYILAGNQYKTMNKLGNYTYNPKTRIMIFTSGPLHLPSDKWMGVYTAKGEPTGNGGKTVDAIIEIRRQTDIEADNKKVLQQCSCVQ